MDLPELLAKECISCSNKIAHLNKTQVRSYLNLLSNWRLQEDKLEREIKTKNFKQSLLLANEIGLIAEQQNHHPDLYISWGILRISVFTHAINGLSENDFILAAKIDKLLEK